MRHGAHSQTPTVADVVHRAAAVCDPDGEDELIADLVLTFEDHDEPVSALGDRERTFFEAAERLAGTMPAGGVEMAAAVATYLAFRRDEVADDDDHLLRLAARSEYGEQPPGDVAEWLRGAGVTP